MIKGILVATDGSDYAASAWEYALEVARAYGAELRILSVVDLRVFGDRLTVPAGRFDPLNLDATHSLQQEVRLEAEQHQMLEEVQRATESRGVAAQTMLVRGSPALQIAAAAAMVDLVALGHRGGRSRWGRLLTGSVAEAVVRRSPRPVLLAPERHSPLARILAAYDGREASRRALHWAADVASTLRLPLAVVHAARLPEPGRRMMDDVRDYLVPYEIPAVHTIVRDGRVPAVIVDSAREYGAGLIVMGAHGHGRVREAVLGSVTEAVMDRTQTPLLLVR